MKYRLCAVLLPLFLMVGPLTAQQQPSRVLATFCDDDAPADLRLRPVVLPKAVLTALLNTKEAREARKSAENDGQPVNLAKLFRGAKVDLADSPDSFFLVIGKSPMSGADNTWFWIVRQSGEQASVLLWEGANCLNVEQTRTLGFKNISSDWSSAATTATATFVYDGNRYRLKKRKYFPVSERRTALP